MAIYYFRNTGDAAWNTASNWSLTDGGGATGVVPTSTDDAYFTSNSGSCVVAGTTGVCTNLIFAGVGAGNYSGTLSLTSTNIFCDGNIALSPTMSISTSGTFSIYVQSATTATITSNGKIFTGNFRPGSPTGTFTFADSCVVTGIFYFGGGTFNGSSITAQGDINSVNHGIAPSTTTLTISGTANQAFNTGIFRLPLATTINKTGGTLTLAAQTTMISSLTYTAGTVDVTTNNNTLFIGGSGNIQNTTFNMSISGINWNNVTFDVTNASPVTFLQDLYVLGTLTLGSFTRQSILNGGTIYARGSSVTNTLTTGTVLGTTSLVIDGSITQTVTMPSILNGRWGINTTFNNPSIIISGTFSYGTSGTLTALQPVTVTGGSLLQCGLGGVTFNTGLVQWQNVSIFPNSAASGAVTLGETLYVNGNAVLGSAAVATIINGSDLKIYGNLTCNVTSTQVSGTSTIYLEGDGPQVVSMPAAAVTGAIRSNMIIHNKYVSFNGTFFYNTGTLTFLSNVIAKNSTLYINANTNIVNAHLAVWSFVNINSVTLTLNEFFSGSPDIRTIITPLSVSGYSIGFTDGFEKISKFIKITGAVVINPNQLLVITDGWNKYAAQDSAVQNVGIRSINTSPNGIPKNKPSTLLADGYGLGSFLVSDPVTKNMI
jgi:hypothetical protein